jgi:hypothetical protein
MSTPQQETSLNTVDGAAGAAGASGRPSAQPGVDQVTGAFAAVYAEVLSWHATVCELLTGAGAGSASSAISVAQLDAWIEDLVVPVLAQKSTLIIGAGFVCAPGFLVGAPWHLSWWLGKFNKFRVGKEVAATRRLEAAEDPSSENFRDYTMLEWWRVPVATRRPHITGPYVDYLCTDDYTLTMTVPMIIDDTVVGVVGADFYAEDVERILLPALREVGETATLVNRSGRVVVSTAPHRATGSILRLEGLSAVLKALDTAGTTIPREPTTDAVVEVIPIRWGGTCLAIVVEA